MTAQHQRTFEEEVLARRPDVRRSVLGSDEFRAWKDGLPTVEVDGGRLYVRGGDMLQDEAQLVYDWAHRTGQLTDADVDAAAREHWAATSPSSDLELVDPDRGG
jgi:hypothetical protein